MLALVGIALVTSSDSLLNNDKLILTITTNNNTIKPMTGTGHSGASTSIGDYAQSV